VLNKVTLDSLLNIRPYIITSSFIPTNENISILSKGPTFCFPNNPSIKVYYDYILDFIRRLQWHILLKKHTFSSRNRFGYKKSKTWANPLLINENIKTLSKKILHSSIQILKKSSYRQSSEKFQYNHVKITTADKGSNWIIMSHKHYNQEGNDQLSNTNFYTRLEKPKHKHNNAAINRLIDYLYVNKYINLTEKRFLINTNSYKVRNFYLLPKVHKKTWSIANTQPKGRPIVNCKHSESYQIAIFIDYFLQPIVKQSSSYVQDSFHFLSLIHNLNVSERDILITIDVQSLYTNIPIDGAIEAIKRQFIKYPDNKRPDSVIINLLKIILFNNDFTFDNSTYLQNSGVAMGQRFAPSVANIYLNDWEENVRLIHPNFPSIWLRYIDDIFTIWNDDLNSFFSFFDEINSFDRHIKFTYEYSHDSIDFLDLTIFKNSNTLCNKVFFKATNSHTILHPSSSHPKHIFKGILYSQIRRWASLCSFREDFNAACSLIFPVWQSRGYTKTILRNSKSRVLAHLNLKDSWKHSFTSCQSCPIENFTYNCKIIQINNISFSILGNLSCNLQNVIYIIFCSLCKQFYVGYCTDFHQRMTKHINAIKNKCHLPVHKHFSSICTIKSFKCLIIDSAATVNKLKIKESKYIKKFNTRVPKGFNVVQNYSSFPNLILPFNDTSQKISTNIKLICSRKNLNIKTIYKQGKNLAQILS